jgi:hypothetical protein
MSDTPGTPDHAAPAAPAEADARQRALRTLVQQLLLDVLLAVALTVSDVVGSAGFQWRLLGLAVAKTALATAASYLARHIAPPASPNG